jgi:hypothetical protein
MIGTGFQPKDELPGIGGWTTVLIKETETVSTTAANSGHPADGSLWRRFATADLDEALAFFRTMFLNLSIRRKAGKAVDLRTSTAYLDPETSLTRMHSTVHTDILAEPESDVNVDLVLDGTLSITDHGRHAAVTCGGVLLLPVNRSGQPVWRSRGAKIR